MNKRSVVFAGQKIAVCGHVKSGQERAAAVASLQRIPRKVWPTEQAQPLIERLMAYLQGVPAD